jgi:hypothetical protein
MARAGKGARKFINSRRPFHERIALRGCNRSDDYQGARVVFASPYLLIGASNVIGNRREAGATVVEGSARGPTGGSALDRATARQHPRRPVRCPRLPGTGRSRHIGPRTPLANRRLRRIVGRPIGTARCLSSSSAPASTPPPPCWSPPDDNPSRVTSEAAAFARAVRRGSDPGRLGQGQPRPARSQRRPPGELGAVGHRHHPPSP